MGPWLAFSSRGVSYSAKPLEFIYTVNVTKRLVCSIRGALAFRGVNSSAKPLGFIYTVNVTKRLVCSLRGALALGELAP